MKNIHSNFVRKNIQKFKNSFKRTNEGGISIRYKRTRKFTHLKKEFSLGIKVVAVWYLLIFSLVQFSETNAGYNDVELLSLPIVAGEWGESPPPDNDEWDNSSFEMDGSTVGVEGCTIHTTIYNSGDEANSISTWRYLVYKLDSNEDVIGEPVNTGVVPIIESKEEGRIESEVTENGEYKIRVRRPLGHPAGNDPDEEGYTYLGWSKTIEVEACSEQSEDEDLPEETEPVSMEVEGLEGVSSESSVTLNWSNPIATNFSYVNVYRNNENTPVAANIKNGEFLDTELDADTVYIYRITTVDTNGKESSGAKYSVRTEKILNDEKSEEQPIDVSDVKWVQNGQSSNVDITWSNPLGDNFSHFILYKDGSRLIEVSENSYKDKDLVKKQNYIYKIVTVTKSGKESEGIEITVNLK
ncbi:amyloid fiber anchoring/assembly protein TapA [Sutcliffiella horikoshii]|uniref:amyloid fiber anchoring/assembly protein TapA n=1 Tax=Sutcliffiella horikoshii TaxID=79883 RepID=UPI003CF9C183